MAFTAFSTGLLLAFGEISRRFVGILYLDPELDIVKISRLSFWGKRKDEYVERKDIVPLSDSDQDINQIVWSLKFYDGVHEDMLMCTKLGGLGSRKHFEKVFGNIEG